MASRSTHTTTNRKAIVHGARACMASTPATAGAPWTSSLHHRGSRPFQFMGWECYWRLVVLHHIVSDPWSARHEQRSVRTQRATWKDSEAMVSLSWNRGQLVERRRWNGALGWSQSIRQSVLWSCSAGALGPHYIFNFKGKLFLRSFVDIDKGYDASIQVCAIVLYLFLK
jgi:hypothetical protein